MANEKKLIYRLEAENAKFLRKLEQSEAKLKQFANKAKRENDLISKSFTALGKRVAAAFAVFASADLVKGIATTAARFEKLNAQLRTVEGSAGRAELAFKKIQDFATTTPFQLDEVVDAYIRLKNRGIEPTEQALRGFGNVASSMGKSLEQISEAVADAITGEFERLKEFGIKANKDGETIRFTFRGVTTEVRNSADEIGSYLEDLGNIQFAGAMTEQMDTLNGVSSNLGDAFDKLSLKIASETGFTDALKRAGKAITEFVNELAGVSRPVDVIQQEIDALSKKLDSISEGGGGRAGARNRGRRSGILAQITDLKDELLAAQLSSTSASEVEQGIKTLTASIEEIENRIAQQIAAGETETSGSGRNRRLTQLGENIKELEALQQQLTEAEGLLSSLNQSEPQASGGSGVENLNKLDDALKDVEKTLQNLRSPLDIYLEQTELATELLLAEKISLEQYDLVMEKYLDDLEEAVTVQDDFNDRLKRAAEITEAATTPFEQMLLDLKELKELLSDGLISQETFDRTVAGMKETAKEVDELKNQVNAFADEAKRNLQDGLVDVLVNGFDKGLESMGESFRRFLIQAAAELAASEFLKFASGLFGGGSNTSSGTGAFATLLSAYAGGKADGGPVRSGQFALVGEEGPELITGPANVIPLKGGMGKTVNINIDARNADPQTQEQMRTLAAVIKNDVLLTLEEGAYRGGF